MRDRLRGGRLLPGVRAGRAAHGAPAGRVPAAGGSTAAAAVLTFAALAACSAGSTASAGSSAGSGGSSTGSGGGTSAPAASSTPGATAPSTGATAPSPTGARAGAPILPARKGSPPIPWDTASATRGVPGPAGIPSAASGSARLTIVLDDGSGSRATWTLRCDPPGGNHPDPARACGVLGANGAVALPPTPADQACTQIYGGPQRALVEGTWRGMPVKSRFGLENGCETTRWRLMLGLLPPGGPP